MERLHIAVPMRWGDIDGYNHVNNTSMLRFLEEARAHAFWTPTEADPDTEPPGPLAVIDASSGSDTLVFVAHQEIEYVEPIPYLRAPLDVQLWIGRIGGASLDLCYEIHSPRGLEPDVLYALAETTIVLVRADSRKPRRLTEAERAAWEPYVGVPVRFRH